MHDIVANREGMDFLSKGTQHRRQGRTSMALQGKVIELVTAETIFVSHHLCALELIKCLDPVARLYPRAERTDADFLLRMQSEIRAHGHTSHTLDTGGDDNVLGAAHHRLRGKMDRLLRGSALAVDGNCWNTIRQV